MKWSVCQLLGVTLLSTVVSACQSGWNGYRDSCYQFNVVNKQSWSDAKNECHKVNAHLVVIETQEENDFLAAHLNGLISSTDIHHDSASSVWIGGSDDDTEGFWEWSDINKLILEYTNWAPGEPDTGGGDHDEDCISMVGRRHFQWQDRRCSESHSYVCEITEGSHAVG
ncbi:perlucin-like [Mercenaria mercenaria]|uniref:perlucin-like n=1 Tax=Mercenaria mercenaria TaxID=6596 RepID=UPI00234E4C5F|nr:perlucin-like [Mercenaria mercenaria]